jgi:hypothetical protein
MSAVNYVAAETRSFNVDGLTYKVPASIEDFDNLAKAPGTALECAIAYVTEKDTLVKLRKAVIDRLAEATGIKRKMKDSGKKRKVKTIVDGNEVESEEAVMIPDETEVQYFKRVCAQQGVEPEAFKGLIQEELDKIPFDPSASERGTKEKKIPQVYLDTAQEILDQGAAEPVAASLTEELGYTVEATLESIAKAIQANEARLRKERAAQYISKAANKS